MDLEHEALNSLEFPIHDTIDLFDSCQWEILYQPIQFPNLRHLHFDLKNGSAVESLRLLDPNTKKHLPKLESIHITTPEDTPFKIPDDVKGIVEQIRPLKSTTLRTDG